MPYRPRLAGAPATLPASAHSPHVAQPPLARTTVMGPGLEKTPHRGIMEPPKISNSGDHASWKRDVANWVDFIVASSEKGEELSSKGRLRTIRTISSRLFSRLWTSWPSNRQWSLVTRLIDWSNRVSNCTRKSNETLSSLRNSVHWPCI